ncbi:efflux transporter outer membrane subunit [Formivibrio citricus]|nr:efflux transporter outer membrane subunit [Formivibrio citricus]
MALLLAGCAGSLPYKMPTLDIPALWKSNPAAVAAAQPTDPAQWWKTLGDPVLDQLIESALQNSPDLRLAAAKVREARAQKGVSDANLWPSLNATANASRSKNSKETGSGATGNQFSAGLDASWELDLFGGLRSAAEASDASLQASIESLRDTRVTLLAETAQGYIDYRGLQARLQVARDNLKSQEETLAITRWRQQAGLVTELDVAQASTSVEQARAAIPALEKSLESTRNSLAVLAGLTPTRLAALLEKAGSIPQTPASLAIGIPADTLRQRPDVRAAEQQLFAKAALVKKAEAARYPSLTLSGSIGLEALRAGRLFSADAMAGSIAAGLTAPIFDAGRIRQNIAIQTAQQEQVLATYEKTVLQALADVENALVALNKTRERETSLQAADTSANEALALARARYQAGLIDFLPLLEAQRTQLSADDSRLSAAADRAKALVQLYKALGGGWTPG